ncbi:MAG TPA: hypothetical protein VKY27_09910 [Bacteriovoracaceae bacterium]|nr:hypothetical protein [Bacteriovoracaceae bacterium]
MRLLLILFLVIGCASKPTLYPNSHYKAVGKDKAQEAVNQCMKESEEYLKNSKAKQVGKSAGVGAAIGAAWGAATGIFTGDYGRGLVRGATVGGAVGATSGAVSPDQMKRRYVNQCLAEKGFQVIGWD